MAEAAGEADFEFTLMTFNVEEFWHGFDTKCTLQGLAKGLKKNPKAVTEEQARDWFKKLKDTVFAKIAKIRAIIEAQNPDVLCLQEHSLGLDPEVVKKLELSEYLDSVHNFTHEDILEALLPDSHKMFAKGSGENPAKFSELANAVAWKTDKLELSSPEAQVGAFITPVGKKDPSGKHTYTSRSVACVGLRPVGGGTPFVVCSAHLLGGRFEDSLWAADSQAGQNERVNQVKGIVDILQSGNETWGITTRSVIAGDFNVMRKGFLTGPFAENSRKYVMGNGMLYTREHMEKDYVNVYVPYQLAVHDALDESGHTVAYGRDDNIPEMKTSFYGGCTDWMYVKGIESKKNETIISSNVPGYGLVSDHNAVLITLTVPSSQSLPGCVP